MDHRTLAVELLNESWGDPHATSKAIVHALLHVADRVEQLTIITAARLVEEEEFE